MRKIFLSAFALFFVALACKQANADSETILSGNLDLLVDETLSPLIEDEVAVFESEYPGRVKLVVLPEKELVLRLVNDTSAVAIMARNLTENERKIFDKRKIIPKVTPFGRDAVVFLRNANNRDSLLSLREMAKFMRGEESAIKGIVLDNPNSGTLSKLMEATGVDTIPTANVYSFKTTAEAIRYVSQNDGMVGVVAMNHISQPTASTQAALESISILSVQPVNGGEYIYPSQDALAAGKYPLARDLFVVNCQGYSGLGVGVASFIAGEKGQRIMLKSGLLPIRIPGRNIIIRNEIQNKTEN